MDAISHRFTEIFMFLDMKKKIANAAAVATVTALTAGPALAQAVDIDAEIASAGTKIVGYATAVVGIMVGFWAIKRSGQKMGWW